MFYQGGGIGWYHRTVMFVVVVVWSNQRIFNIHFSTASDRNRHSSEKYERTRQRVLSFAAFNAQIFKFKTSRRQKASTPKPEDSG
jgi:hypothetical protein